jgi:hypothetical protein
MLPEYSTSEALEQMGHVAPGRRCAAAIRRRPAETRQNKIFRYLCRMNLNSEVEGGGLHRLVGWMVRGANAVIALRCCCISAKFESYWEGRAS